MSRLTDPAPAGPGRGSASAPNYYRGAPSVQVWRWEKCGKNKINVTHGLWDTWGVCTSLGSSIGALFSPTLFSTTRPPHPPVRGT